jgi:hypothetical protein
MNRPVWWVVLILAWVAIGAGAYYWWRQQAPPPAPPPAPVAEAPAPAPPAPPPAEPQIRHPIEEARPDVAAEPAKEAAAPLPPLGESDKPVLGALAGLVGRKAVDAFVVDTGIVQRIVATVDNLPRSKASPNRWPVRRTAGEFTTTARSDGVYTNPANDRRYEPLLRVMESADTGKLVALYVRFYPLFQQAYEELGYPKRHFNDRLIEVIDHLLATPELKGPLRLVPPEVKGPVKLERPWELYRFADPELEARSAGQKILIRMGAGNAGVVKAKLRDIRRQLTQRGTP